MWAHPVDAHFAAKSLVGWPKMRFQVWSMDAHGAKDLAGYGFAHVPTAAGEHEVEVATWCPEGTAAERLSAFFVGGRPRLKFEEVIHQPGDRFRLQTKAAGVVRLRLRRLRQGLRQVQRQPPSVSHWARDMFFTPKRIAMYLAMIGANI